MIASQWQKSLVAGRIDLSVCDLAKLFFDFGSDFHALRTERNLPIVKIAFVDKCGEVTVSSREIEREIERGKVNIHSCP